MAHNLMTMKNGQSAYIGRQSAWHQLGTVTGSYLTWIEILEHGALDFDVTKEQLLDCRGNLTEAYGTFRQDRDGSTPVFLGTVGKDYNVIQHRNGFEMIDALVASADGGHYETAGVLGNGEQVWGLADLRLSVSVGDDVSNGYLLFSTSHDGSMSYSLRTCVERVVCANTLAVALSEKAKGSFSIRHTKRSSSRVADVHATLDGMQGDMRTIGAKLNFLAERKMNREAVCSILDRLFPKSVKGTTADLASSTRRENILSSVLSIYEDNDGNAFKEQRGTAYNLLNAITNYTDHERSSKGNNRAESALFGSGDALKSKAFEYITESAQTLPTMERKQTFLTVSPAPVVSTTGMSLLDAIVAESKQ